MVAERNKAKAVADKASNHSNKSNLFAGGDTEPTSSWCSSKRMQIKEKCGAPKILSITVLVDGIGQEVDVLEPLHPGDALWIRYDAASIGVVLKYFRGARLNGQKKQASLPTGIYQSGEQLVATHKDEDGKKRYKVSADLDDLLAWRAK